jgi:type II secretory pathway predicted ATPase ExeA
MEELMSKERKDFSKMSKTEMKALAEKIFIVYPRLTSTLEKIRHCHEYSKIAAEPECMFIGGETGTGKTTLYEYYEAQFPRMEDENCTKITVLSSATPQRATEKTLVGEILESIGDPSAKKGTADSQTSRLRKFIKACGVEIIILDEFQHFVDGDSKKILKNVSDWLKNLINATRKPIVLIGQPYADEVLDACGNEQLQRRFLVRETLEPFGWPGERDDAHKKAAKQKEFRAFLRAVDSSLPFNEESNLSDPLMAYRIYCGTNGRVSKVMAIVRRASELAIDDSMRKLDIDVLGEAYENRLRKIHPKRDNPFHTDFKDLKIEPFEDETPEFLRKKREVEERASEVLKK